MTALIGAHVVATIAVSALWALGLQVSAYHLWTNLQGPLAAVMLLRLTGERVSGWRTVGSGLLMAAAWCVLFAFPFVTPPAVRLVGTWSASPWASLGLLPILGLSLPLSAFVSSTAIRLATRSTDSPFRELLLWNALPAAFVVLAHESDHVWLAIPLALSWHLGLLRAVRRVANEAASMASSAVLVGNGPATSCDEVQTR